MTQVWEKDKVVPVTLIEAGPCFVAQLKEGAIQLGFEKLKDNKIKKSQKSAPYRYLREFKTEDEYKVGQEIGADVFKEGDKVKISGISKGKGFQGGVKRWGFSGFGKSHGVKHGERKIGSIGSAFPERVFKGKKMPGRMGSQRTTIKNLKIVKIDKDNNLIAVKGAIPSRRGTLVEIRG